MSEDTPKKKEKPNNKEGFLDLARTFVIAVALAMVFRSLLLEPFHIPSGSMRSTLLEGDYIFVYKPSYGYSRYSFPFGAWVDYFDGRIWADTPERGDVVVFRLPRNTHVDYIKRIIGLPGDRVQVKDGVLFLNGEQVKRTPTEAYHTVSQGGVERRINRYIETLPSGREYMVLDETRMGDADYTEEYVVPEGHYFAMGDNRDNSVDSRFAEGVGFVPFENMVGRAELILFSWDGDKAKLWEVWNWPSAIRTDRFFELLG